MKTFSSFAYSGNAMLRFGCSVMSIASLTLFVLSAEAGQGQRGLRSSVESTIIASCSSDCFGRLMQCFAAGTADNICYSNYNLCMTRCSTGGGWASLPNFTVARAKTFYPSPNFRQVVSWESAKFKI
jgi:hypothetical protein